MSFDTFGNDVLNYLETGDFEALTEAFCQGRAEMSAFLAFRMQDPASPMFLGSERVDPELVEVMRSHYLTPESNPVIAALPYALPGKLLHKTELVSADHFDRQGVYDNFVRPSDTDHFGTALYRGNSGLFMFTIGHLSAFDWMNENEATRTSMMLQQMVRAVDLRLRMEIGSCASQCVVLIDQAGVIRVMDDLARATIEECFKIANGRLCPKLKKDVRRFDKAVERALSGQNNTVFLSDRNGYGVSVALSRGPDFPYEKTVRLELGPLKRATWDVEGLRAAYNLTHAEAVVTLALLEGRDVRGIANHHGLKPDTVRVYLKRVYLKTGKHGQAQLISHLLN
ncbi:MAG: hypothetical protein AAGE61_12415 [Pseudomonadota bacterium]